ncbi:MAG: septum formation initiator family protein [Mogibacterium sp.]|nr:septum formation initiator family protein [Mogibacterium sp.]
MSEERYEWTTEYDGYGTETSSEEASDEEQEVAEAAEFTEAAQEEPVLEEEFEPEEEELSPEEQAARDAELAARIAARRRKYKWQKTRRKSLAVIGVIALFAMLFTMCGREIFRLKAENYALRKQQQELEEERDRLARELERVGDKEYIKDQARKQLRLLDPGEIMFVFQDSAEAAAAEAEEGAEAGAEAQSGEETDNND